MLRPPLPTADMKFNSPSSVSPSFTSYSSNNLYDIAARVVEEFRNENGHDDDEDIYNFNDDDHESFQEFRNENGKDYDDDDDDIYNLNDDVNQVHVPADHESEVNRTEIVKQSDEELNEDEEFEFDVCVPYDSSAEFNGEIQLRYPLFDRSLLLNDVVTDKSDVDSKPHRELLSPVVRRPLRKLFLEERETASCSSSESDDLDGVSPETYCIWKPKEEQSSLETCKKSNSTGNTSKRWRFRNLLHRSNSDVNYNNNKNDDSVIVFRKLTATKSRSEKAKKVEKTAKVAGADDDGEPATVTDEINSPNKTIKEGNRVNRSYVPHKQDLVGVFANVNGLSRNLNRFSLD